MQADRHEFSKGLSAYPASCKRNNWRSQLCPRMVLPIVDEVRPKCYACHAGFDDIDGLRKHQLQTHKKEYEENDQVPNKRGPAPGDVSVF